MGELREYMSRARRAQQENEQKHSVQLEIPAWEDQEADVNDFNERRQAQLEDEVGRDPRD